MSKHTAAAGTGFVGIVETQREKAVEDTERGALAMCPSPCIGCLCGNCRGWGECMMSDHQTRPADTEAVALK